MSRRVLLLLSVACVAIAGCASVFGVESELRLRTSSGEYHVGAPIEVKIENETDEDMYVAHCNHRVTLLIQRRVGEAWENYRQANGPLCLGIYPMGELLIAAASERTETVQIEEPGEYRLQLYARRSSEDFGSTVVHSGTFQVRYPPD